MTQPVTQPVTAAPLGAQPRNVADLVVTILLLAVFAVVGLGLSAGGAMLAMASDSCGSGSVCNDNLLGLGVLLAIVAPWLCWVPTVVVVVVRQVRRRLTWWVPIVGGLAYVPLAVAAFLVVNAGVRPVG